MAVTFETLVAWAHRAEPEARADAAHGLGRLLGDLQYREQALATLGTLLADASADVAGAALESLRSDRDCPTAVFEAGLASPHESIRAACRARTEPDVPEPVDPLALRRAALRRRKAPRANPATKYLTGFLADVASDNIDGADDYVYMLTPGDWVTLAAELPQRSPEQRSTILTFIGRGDADGLFILLAYLRGPHEEDAALAIAHMAEEHADQMALTTAELAVVRQHVPDFELPIVID